MSGKPYDVIELKDQIKSLKLKRQSLLEEQKDLKEQIKVYEAKSSQLKLEYNILGPIGELRYGSNDIYEGSNRSIHAGDYVESKYDGNDRKMELQILNTEMRAALPALEAEALKWEKRIANAEKKADVLTGKISKYPDTLIKPVEVLEKELGDSIELRIKLKSKLARDVDTQKREKAKLFEDVLQVKDKLLSMLDEKDALKYAGHRAKHNMISEAAKIEVLLNEQSRLRDQVATYVKSYDTNTGASRDDGRWEQEAFYSVAASESDRLTENQVFDVISKWLPPQQVNKAREKGLISFYCRGSGTSAAMDYRSFCQLCEKIQSDSD